MSIDRAQAIINQRRVSQQMTARDKAIRQFYHEEDGKIVIRTTQDVQPHIEYAAACRRAEAEGRGRFGKRGTFHRTMSTPINVIYAVATKLGIPLGKIFEKDCAKRIDKELKTEFPCFRTTIDKKI